MSQTNKLVQLFFLFFTTVTGINLLFSSHVETFHSEQWHERKSRVSLGASKYNPYTQLWMRRSRLQEQGVRMRKNSKLTDHLKKVYWLFCLSSKIISHAIQYKYMIAFPTSDTCSVALCRNPFMVKFLFMQTEIICLFWGCEKSAFTIKSSCLNINPHMCSSFTSGHYLQQT